MPAADTFWLKAHLSSLIGSILIAGYAGYLLAAQEYFHRFLPARMLARAAKSQSRLVAGDDSYTITQPFYL